MKRILPTLLLVATFVVASLIWEGHVRNHAESLVKTVDEAMEAIKNKQDFTRCVELLSDFSKQWEHVHDSWETLIAHKRLTDIDSSLVQAQFAAQNGDAEQTLSHLGVLRLDMVHLGAYYSISWSNLL